MRDFGFPSVHTLNAITVSGVLLKHYWEHSWFYFTNDVVYAQYVFCSSNPVSASPTPLSRYLFVGAVALGLLWCVSIPLSRMYVGMHSPLDCIGGAIGGVCVLFWWLSLFPILWRWMTVTRTYLEHVVIITGLLAITVHPRSNRNSPSFHGNIAVIGIIAGCILGVSWYPFTVAQASDVLPPLSLPTFPVAAAAHALGLSVTHTVSLFRILIGLVAVALAKVIVEPILRQLLALIFVLPVFSTLKAWISLPIYALILPHPPALNNADHPISSFEKEVEEYERQLQDEWASTPKRAVREAGILSRAVTHCILGIAIVNWTRVVFPFLGLAYQQ
jgi:hypothetical protein